MSDLNALLFTQTGLLTECEAVTPSDDNDLPFASAGISVNQSGLVRFQPAKSSGPVTRYLSAGIVYPFVATRIFATGTDADVAPAIHA